MQIIATMAAAIVVVLALYILMVRILTRSLEARAFSDHLVEETASYPSVSVVVAFRNEAVNLPRLLKALQEQDFTGSWEVVLVDDHSCDGAIAAGLHPPFRLLALPKGKNGKKAALHHGIANAVGEIVITTDADARPGPGWIREVAGCFARDAGLHMLSGPVALEGDGWFARLQAMELATVMAVTAITTEAGFPLMANGANLTFKRKDFLDAGGYAGNAHIASGDDHFLLQSFHRHWPGGVRFRFDPRMVVRTDASLDVGSFLRQRIRWASKWRSDPGPALAALTALSVQVATILVAPVAWQTGQPGLLILLAARWLTEYLLLRVTSRWLDHPLRVTDFLLLVLVYPWYVTTTAVGTLGPSPEWKGRS